MRKTKKEKKSKDQKKIKKHRFQQLFFYVNLFLALPSILASKQ